MIRRLAIAAAGTWATVGICWMLGNIPAICGVLALAALAAVFATNWVGSNE